MYHRCYFLIVAIILIMTGCADNKKTQDIYLEPEEVSLESIVFINDSLLEKPISLVAADNAIVLSNSDTMDDSLVSIFDLDGNFIRNCMPHGSGPMEVLRIANIQYSEKDTSIYVADLQKNKIFRISDYTGVQPLIEEVFSYLVSGNDSIMLHGNAGCLSNGQFIVTNATSNGAVVLFDNCSKQIGFLGHLPDKELVDSRLSDVGNGLLYQPRLAISPKGDYASLTYSISDSWFLLNMTGNKMDCSHIDGAPANDIYLVEAGHDFFMGAVTGKTRVYTLSVCVSNDFVYQLYIGLTNDEIEDTIFFKDTKRSGSNIVRVYDRKGNHVKTITLDRWATALAVSPDDSYLYTLTQSSEDGYTVLRYEL